MNGKIRLVELRTFYLVIFYHSPRLFLLTLLSSFFNGSSSAHPLAKLSGFLLIGYRGDLSWESFTLDRIHKARELMRGGGLHALDTTPPLIDTIGMSLHERRAVENTQKTIERRLKEGTDGIGKNYREKVDLLKEGNAHRTSLITYLLVQHSKPGVGSGSNSRLARPIEVIDDEEEDKSIPSLSLKRKASAAKISP